MKKQSQNLKEILSELEQQAYKEGKPVKDNDCYNGWTNWDTWETMLILDNTQETQRWLESWKKNFLRKIKGGRFDIEKAKLVVFKYLVPAARGKKMWFKDLAVDKEIDPKKVNKAEILYNILSD